MSNEALDQIERIIDNNGVVILDGGFSNQLSLYGYKFERSELWTSTALLDRPDLVKKVHLDYLISGSNIITTVTYQATFQKLREKFKYSREQIHDLFELAIQCAEEAIEKYMESCKYDIIGTVRPLIAISIGSYGAYTGGGNEYKGIYDIGEDELLEFHKERFVFIAKKLRYKIGLIAFETIPNFLEAKALVRLSQRSALSSAWMSFSIRPGTQCIADGTPIEQLVELVRDVQQIFAIGVNCLHPKDVEPILKKLKESNTNKKIIVYPNNGDDYDASTGTFIASNSEYDWIDQVAIWKAKYGLSIIGGCCRVGEKEIGRIRNIFS